MGRPDKRMGRPGQRMGRPTERKYIIIIIICSCVIPSFLLVNEYDITVEYLMKWVCMCTFP